MQSQAQTSETKSGMPPSLEFPDSVYIICLEPMNAGQGGQKSLEDTFHVIEDVTEFVMRSPVIRKVSS